MFNLTNEQLLKVYKKKDRLLQEEEAIGGWQTYGKKAMYVEIVKNIAFNRFSVPVYFDGAEMLPLASDVPRSSRIWQHNGMWHIVCTEMHEGSEIDLQVVRFFKDKESAALTAEIWIAKGDLSSFKEELHIERIN